MGAKAKRVGGTKGGEAFSGDFMQQIMRLLGGQSGQMGAGNIPGGGAMQSGQGAADIYGSVLGQGAGEIGGALMQLLQRTQDRDVMKLKESARATGGAQFGTPGAYAESMYRAEAAPQITKAIGELQLGAAKDIFGMGQSIYNRETPQADIQIEPGIFDKILQGVGAIAPAAASIFAPGIGAIPGISASAMEQVNSTRPGNVTPVTVG